MERKELLTQEAGESGNSTHNYRHQRTENRDSNGNLYVTIHSSTIHKAQKVETTQVFIKDKWIKKMWYIHAIEFYSPIKTNKILILPGTQMDLENIILRERSQTRGQRSYDSTYMKCLEFHKAQFHRDRKSLRGYQGLAGGALGSYWAMGTEFLFGMMK